VTASPFLVSKASAVDLPAVLSLVRQCELLETGIAEVIASFLIARSGSVLVGCAGLEKYGELGLLRSVAVAPSARGTGIGAKLLEGMAAAARADGVRELFLLTTTAASYFERHGFTAIPRSSAPTQVADSWEFRVGCPETAVAMRLALKEA
jgi:N-acetylglutamate synthase-like GNAT family acetyltransferase